MKKLWNELQDFFSDKEDTEEPGYDPAHVGGVIVCSLLGISLLFWLLWSLLVFGGGIQAKIIPFLQVIFTSKTISDFGYIGYPYEMGVFKGWITNLAALVFCVTILTAVWFLFKKINEREK